MRERWKMNFDRVCCHLSQSEGLSQFAISISIEALKDQIHSWICIFNDRGVL